MQESTLWAVSSVAGLTVLGAAGGAAVVLTDNFTPAAFAAMMFAGMFLACGFAMQLYRRGHDYATLVGGLAGFLATFAFFATPVGIDLARGQSFPPLDLAMLLVVPALVAGSLSAGGTLFLMRGVRRYRAKNGLIHAPQGVERPER
ncbi:MAG: hypothetical protein QOE90_2703 [Thermoplasmata archaeon]|jgi:hypothetical protein|nr:hypothetical protein [Thermoplasmata archaeon]